MNLNDDVVYRCLRLGPLRQLHPGRSRGLVRYNDRLHRNYLLDHLSLWWKCRRERGRAGLSIVAVSSRMAALPIQLDRAKRAPLAAQIYSAMREDIETANRNLGCEGR